MKNYCFITLMSLAMIGCSGQLKAKPYSTKSLADYVEIPPLYFNPEKNIKFQVNVVDNQNRNLGKFTYLLTCVKDTELSTRVLDLSVKYSKNPKLENAPLYRIGKIGKREFLPSNPGTMWIGFKCSFSAGKYPDLSSWFRQRQIIIGEAEKGLIMISFGVSNGSQDTAKILTNLPYGSIQNIDYNVDTNKLSMNPVPVLNLSQQKFEK